MLVVVLRFCEPKLVNFIVLVSVVRSRVAFLFGFQSSLLANTECWKMTLINCTAKKIIRQNNNRTNWSFTTSDANEATVAQSVES